MARPAPAGEVSTYLDGVLGPQGDLARAIPGFRARPGQRVLAAAIDEAITSRAALLAEGGTGIGKSMAYLVPAVFRAMDPLEPKRVLVVTANIALQEQLVAKDLPTLQKATGWDFTWALLKGRSQYLCVRKYARRDAAQMAHLRHASFGPDRDRGQHLAVLEAWADAAILGGIEQENGDASELPFEDPEVWRTVSVSADECQGQRCPQARHCFALAAQARAKQATVVVTNYHMLYAHYLVVQTSGGMASVLPSFGLVVMDEAHKAPDIARDFFGWRFTKETVRRVGKAVGMEDAHLPQQLEAAATTFFGVLETLARDRRRYRGSLDPEHLTDAERDCGKKVVVGLRQAITLAAGRAKGLFDKLGSREIEPGHCSAQHLGWYEEAVDLEKLVERTLHHAERLEDALNPFFQDGTQVYYLETPERTGVVLASKLLHPRDALAPTLFATRDDGTLRTPVILTSATLSTDRGRMDFIAAEMGAPRDYRSLVAESPFRWGDQALLVIPADDGIPMAEHTEFRDTCVHLLKKTMALADGRTLGLFTSYAAMEHCYDRLVPWCRERGIRLLRQKEMPRTKLIEAFKADTRSCLFGTESFWAGVDVPGEALRAVFIDKLPFPSMDDPVQRAMERAGENWFGRYALPKAMLQFKQGFGRLIRSAVCSGVVVCADRRLIDKGYGKAFLRSLPPVPVGHRMTDVATWFETKGRTG